MGCNYLSQLSLPWFIAKTIHDRGICGHVTCMINNHKMSMFGGVTTIPMLDFSPSL